MFKHILIPTDGSKLSNESAAAAVRFAASAGARVTGFFAAPPPTPIIFRARLPVGYATPREHEEMTRKAAASYLGEIEKLAKSAGVRCETAQVTSDFPAEAIIAEAKKRRCDLIFIASHGRHGLRRASLLGSETQKVLSQSRVPVLVYRKP